MRTSLVGRIFRTDACSRQPLQLIHQFQVAGAQIVLIARLLRVPAAFELPELLYEVLLHIPARGPVRALRELVVLDLGRRDAVLSDQNFLEVVCSPPRHVTPATGGIEIVFGRHPYQIHQKLSRCRIQGFRGPGMAVLQRIRQTRAIADIWGKRFMGLV